MTEQMAIQQLKIQRTFTNGSNAKVDAIDMAIKALKQIQEYRALGTVEELRVARDKQVGKKPIPKYGINNTVNSYHCPTCDNNYLGGGEYRYDCCEDCGQKLDWSDEE